MSGERVNLVSGRVLIGLAVIALLAVLSGYTGPVPSDEETGAHIFQLAIVGLVPVGIAYLATANWKQPLCTARPLTFTGIVLVLAFGALYYLEHIR